MRFTGLSALEKHLAVTRPEWPRLFFVAIADDFERKQALDAILSIVAPPDAHVARMSDCTAKSVLEELASPALFSDCVVVVPDADKKLLDDLASLCKKPISYGMLFIGSKNKAGAWADQGHILDLADEKPWDKDKRWTAHLHEMAHAAGKKLAPDAALWMIERLERDAAGLSHEMDKLLCFAAAKSSIDKADVEAICTPSRTHTLWAIAEDLVWSKIFRANPAELHDPSFFHSLLSSLRQQLQIGFKMHQLLAGKVPLTEWGPHFPKMWPKALEKKAQLSQQLGPRYFRIALDRLFQIELISKNSAAPIDALLDLFRLRL